MPNEQTVTPQRSPSGSPLRTRIERSLQVLAVAALILAFWLMTALPQTRPLSSVTDIAGLPQVLTQWSHRPPEQVLVEVGARPDAKGRDWLAALRKNGAQVTWQDGAWSGREPLGIAAQPVADPHRPVRIWTAMPADVPAEIAETVLGGSDGAASETPVGLSVAVHPRAGSGGGTVSLPALNGNAVILKSGDAIASATLRDSLTLRPVLLLGQASWETRFVTAALEEHGWQVDARVSLAPQQVLGHAARAAGHRGGEAQSQRGQGRETGQRGRDGAVGSGRRDATRAGGSDGQRSATVGENAARPSIDARSRLNAISADRYAAVVVMDESASTYARAIETYVRSGGGLVVLGHGSRAPGLQPLLPMAVLGQTQNATEFEPDLVDIADARPASANAAFAARDHLELRPLEGPRDGTHILETRGEATAVAIHRVDDGRVLQSGYVNSWRWQMAARDPNAPQAYREWLAQHVSMVAYAPREDLPPTLAQLAWHDPAPQAAWHAAFGPADAEDARRRLPEVRGGGLPALSAHWLAASFAIACLAMLAQWLSRRLRGAA